MGKSGADRETSVLLVAPFAADATGGQARFATALAGDLEKVIELHRLAIPIAGEASLLARVRTTVGLVLEVAKTIRMERIDVVHVFSPCNRSAFYEKMLLSAVARLVGARTIFNFRNAFDLWYTRWTPVERSLIPHFIRLNTVVLTQYRQLADFAIDRRLARADRVFVIPNGIDGRTEGPVSSEKPDQVSPLRVIFLGSIGRRKGVDTLLRALGELAEDAALPPFVVSVCGPLDGSFGAEALDRMCRNLGVQRFTDFPGPVVGARKVELLSSSDIFVLPSTAEGFPNSLLEAMAFGLPVVVTSVGAMPDVIQTGVNGFLIPPGDHVALADRIRSLLIDPDLRTRLGAAARETVHERYRMDSVVQQYASLYEHVASLL